MNQRIAYILSVGILLIFSVFFIYPVASVVGFAFMDEAGFTLSFVGEVFENRLYQEGLINALALGVVSTLLSLVIAVPLALGNHRYAFPCKGLLTAGVLLPLVLPPFVGAVGIKHILGVEGALNAFLKKLSLVDETSPTDWLAEYQFFGVALVNALHLYPILYLNLVAALSQIDPTLEQAAENLGCPPWRRFLRVTLPLCLPGLFAGGSIVFIWSFTELGVPLVFDYTRVASVQIYDGLKDLSSNPLPYALVAVMMGVSALIFLSAKFLFGGTKPRSTARPISLTAPRRLGVFGRLAWSSVFVIVTVFAVLPHVSVVALSLTDDWYQAVLPKTLNFGNYSAALGHPLVVPSIKNSLLYAGASTLVDLILGLLIAWIVVRSRVRGRAVLDALVMLPLAVPGLVLAFGYLALSQEGRPFHFLTGSSMDPTLLLIAAYAVRRLPYVVRAAVAGLQQSNPALEEAARSLGATPCRVLQRISLPLIGTSVLSGAILAFAFAMLEVSDSLILAQQSEHFPITKAIYALLSVLGDGPYLAAALGVWAMAFLSVAIVGATFIAGKKGGLFRL